VLTIDQISFSRLQNLCFNSKAKSCSFRRGQKSIQYLGVKIWNSMPEKMRDLTLSKLKKAYRYFTRKLQFDLKLAQSISISFFPFYFFFDIKNQTILNRKTH